MIVQIGDAADDERLAAYLNLTDVALRSRHEPAQGLYIAEGYTVIERAVRAGHRPKSFLMAPKWLESMREVIVLACGADDGGAQVPVFVADEAVLRKLTGYPLHRGALAAMHRPLLPPVAQVLAGARRVAVFEDVVDHTNLGAGLRACAAMGVDAVLITPRCADPLYRRSVRVSMGTVFQVPWTRFTSWPHAGAEDPVPDGIDLLRAHGFTVAALALTADAIDLDELEADPPERLALVFGTEGDGLRAGTIADCDLVVRIPMAGGVDSLNVGSAAAVALWATRLR